MSEWIWSIEALKATPSMVKDGMSQNLELLLRREGIKIISEVGTHMKCKVTPTISVACVYFHRFYMINTFKAFPREVTALSCLFLAGKVEDFPKKCKDVCSAAAQRFPDIYQKYLNLVDDVMGMERVLLHSLKFDLQVDLPYDALLEYGKLFPVLSKEKITEAVQIAWTFLNDSFYTTLCISCEPQMIAIALLHLAFTVKGMQPVQQDMDPCWWSADISNWPMEAVDKSCHLVLDFYSATKDNPVLENGRLTQI